MIKTRECVKCKEIKPLSKEYWHKGNRSKDGFLSKCKECRNQENRKYANVNKDYYQNWRDNNKEYFQTYQALNREDIRIQKKKYYEENKQTLREYNKKWHEENEGYHNEYYEANKEQIREQKKQYYEDNKEKMQKGARHRVQKYLAKKELLPSTLTPEEWRNILDRFGSKCAYCGLTDSTSKSKQGTRLHQEHFIPLSQGGEYTHNNIIPACRSCNSSKSSKDFFEWYPNYKHYNKEREQFILEYLGYEEQSNTQQLSIL